MVVAQVEERNETKYCHLAMNHRFTQVAIETSCVIVPESRKFIHELGNRLERVTGDAYSLNYLLLQLFVAIQQGISVSVMGSSVPTHSVP